MNYIPMVSIPMDALAWQSAIFYELLILLNQYLDVEHWLENYKENLSEHNLK